MPEASRERENGKYLAIHHIRIGKSTGNRICLQRYKYYYVPPCFVLRISKKKCCVPEPGSSSSIFIIVGAHFLSTPIIILQSSQRMSPLKTLPWALTKWWWCSRRKCLKISFIGRVSEQSNSGHCTGLKEQISSCSRRFWKWRQTLLANHKCVSWKLNLTALLTNNLTPFLNYYIPCKLRIRCILFPRKCTEHWTARWSFPQTWPGRPPFSGDIFHIVASCRSTIDIPCDRWHIGE